MEARPNLWAIILAMGEEPDAGPFKDARPEAEPPAAHRKAAGGASLLERALRLTTTISSPRHTMLVVSDQQAPWWRLAAAALPPENTVVQPCDRGTACSVLLPLLQVLPRDPEAVVLITHAGHHACREDVLQRSVERALQHVDSNPDALVLLGLEPDGDEDPGWGWIDPGPSGPDGVREVLAMSDAPGRGRAEELAGSGALWNSFTFVIRAALLEALFESALPWLPLAFGYAVRTARGERGSRVLETVYQHLPRIDLSDVVLHGSSEELRVLPVPPCGWTQLAAPESDRSTTIRDALASCPPAISDASHGDADDRLQFTKS